MKMGRRLWSALLAIAMVFSMVVVPVRAENSTSVEHSGHDESWTAVSGVDDLSQLSEGGKFYLNADITLTETLTVSSEVTLCLNGHVLDGVDTDHAVSVSGASAVLNLIDCTETVINGYIDGTTGLWTRLAEDASIPEGSAAYNLNGGVITGGNINNTSNLSGGGVYIASKATFNMHSGNIAGNLASGSRYGGGVYIENSSNGVFNMYGGTIAGNKATSGGGVDAFAGTFNMYGGTITRNTATNGGGVYLTNAVLNMSGGFITNNTATSSGGGVYIHESTYTNSSTQVTAYYNGVFNMTAGTVSGNAAANGGGVYVAYSSSGSHQNTFAMTDGVISNNTAVQHGGGVNAYGGTVTVSGGTISGNTANSSFSNSAYEGGGVYVSQYGDFTLSAGSIVGNSARNGGGISANGAVSLTGGSVTENKATNLAGGVYVTSTGNAKLAGAPVITGNLQKCTLGTDGTLSGGTASNLYLRKAVTVGVTDGEGVTACLGSGAYIGVSLYTTDMGKPADGAPVSFTGDNAEDFSKYFYSDLPNSYYVANGVSDGMQVVQMAYGKTTYTVTDTTAANGSLVVEPSPESSGATVTLTPQAAEGYTFKALAVRTTGGYALTATPGGDGTYTFTMPATNVEVSAEFEANTHTVTFMNGEEVVKTVENVPHGGTVAEADIPPVPAKDGYVGTWKVDNADFTADTAVTADTTVTASFRQTGHKHPVCSAECDCPDSSHTEATWVELTKDLLAAENYTLNGGTDGVYYYLAESIDLSEDGNTISIKGTVSLCLNGKVLTGNPNGTAIEVDVGNTLNLTDCTNTTVNGYIYSATETYEDTSKDPAVTTEVDVSLWIADVNNEHAGKADEWDLAGGVITGGNSNKVATHAGGVRVNGTLNLYGGNIAGNRAGYGQDGGGVYVSGTLNMHGGTITGNFARVGGGAYAGTTQFTMTGGKIAKNKASINGGGININSSMAAAVSGGEISGNTAGTNGGGIYVNNKATLTMSGGEIVGNTATKGNGGGIIVYGNATSGGTINMAGGTVTGNTAKADGGGICIGSVNAKAFFAGTPVIKDNVIGGTITNGVLSGGTANNLYLRGNTTTVTVGVPVMNSEGNVTDTNYLAPGASIYVTTASTTVPVNITGNNSDDYSDYFHADNSAYEMVNSGSGDVQVIQLVKKTYTVEIDSTIQNGKVTATPVPAEEGATVTITVTPDEDYVAEDVTVKDASGGDVQVTKSESNTYTFLMPVGNVTVSAVFAQHITYTVTFVADGNTVATQTVIQGEDATVPAVPEKDGYIGVWNHDGKNITADTTITAVYYSVIEHTGEHHGWTAISDAAGLAAAAANGGSYCLTENIQLSATLTVAAGKTLNLCLNGKLITGYANGSAVIISSGATLNLLDCSGATVHGYIDDSGLWKADVTDAHAGKADEHDLTGGAITGGNTGNADGTVDGGGVYNRGTFNMYGGNIAGNMSSNRRNGGGVFLYANSKFTLYGGAIVGNTAHVGGGVYVGTSSFTMFDGKISGNAVTANGGAINVNYNCAATIAGGEISGNIANSNGGAFFVNGNGTLTISGGEIKGNKAGGNGGAMHLYANATYPNAALVMTGGSITGNTARHGGGVSVGAATNIVALGGNPIISGNVIGGTITEGVLTGGTTQNIYLPADATVSVGVTAGGDMHYLTQGASIGITTQTVPVIGTPVTITGNNSEDFSPYFFADNEVYHAASSGEGDAQVVQLVKSVYSVAIADGIQNGTVAVNPASAEVGDTVTVTATPGSAEYITRTVSVTDAAGGTVEVIKGEDGTYTFQMPASNVTVSAEFALPNTYTVTFVVDGSEWKKETVTEGSNAPMPEVPEKVGYTGSWNGDGKNITADTTITAVYTANVYTVTYIAEGQTIATFAVGHGQSVTAPEVPGKSGYTASWNGDGKNITADTTIIAVYLLTDHNTAHDGWKAITSESDLAVASAEGGSWYLANDIRLSAAVNVLGDLTLCLNGKTVTGISVGNSIIVKGGTLSILDCSSETTHGYINAEGLWMADPENAHAGLSDEYDLIGGVITGGNIAGTDNLSGGGIFVQAKGTFNLYGGNIAGNRASGTKYGGGVYIDTTGGTFNMYGGTVAGNITVGNGGAGVFVFDGEFNLYGGNISRNTNGTSMGGGVFLNLGTFNMSGGFITNNVTKTNGAGVYVAKGTFNLTDGVISGNMGTNGAGIYVYPTGALNMSGGSIQNNTSSSGGGGLYVYNGPSVMSGGLISGNKAPSGGGVFVISGEFVMSGGSITGNSATRSYGGGIYLNYNADRNYIASFTMTGGSITGNNAANYSGGVYTPNGCTFRVAGDPVITGNVKKGTVTDGGLAGGTADNIFLLDGATLSLGVDGSNLTDGAQLSVTTRTAPAENTPVAITGTNDGDYSRYFLADNSDCHAETVNGTVYLVAGHKHPICAMLCSCTDSHGSIGWIEVTTEKELITAAANGGNYYLVNDITLTSTLTVAEGKELNLCLNGKILTGSGSHGVLKVSGILNLTDCSTATIHGYIDSDTGLWMVDTGMTHTGAADECDLTGGVVTGGNGTNSGGGVYVDTGSTLNLYGGNIAGNKASGTKYGGGLCVIGNVNMYGGSVTGNAAEACFGGGVYLTGGTFNLYGGTVFQNTSSTNGGGVCVYSGTFNLDGGSITGNTAGINGGGVYVCADGSFRQSSGSVADNTAVSDGGGVYVYGGIANLTGGTVSGNMAANGAGVYIASGTLTMKDAAITGNTAEKGGVYVNAGAVTLSGTTVVRKNTGGNLYLPDGATVNAGLTDGAYIGVTTGTAPTEDAAITITGSANADYSSYFAADIADKYHVANSGSGNAQVLQLCAGATKFQVNITDTQYGTVTVSASPADCGSTVIITATAYENAYVKDIQITDAEGNAVAVTEISAGTWSFVVPASAVTVAVRILPYHIHSGCGSSCACGTSHPTATWSEIFTGEDMIAAAAAGGHYYLVNDVTLTEAVIVTAENFSLCLNGMVLSGSGIDNVLTVAYGTDMTLTDCGSTVRCYDNIDGLWVLNNTLTSGTASTTGGVITGGMSGIRVEGSLAMYGGNITGNAAVNGGGVYVDGYAKECGSFTVYGGNIIGNTAVKGGGVYVNGYNTVFTLSGGEISGNTAEHGGGLYLFHCQYATMDGGKISGNTAQSGGGVFAGRSTYFYMTGGELSGNTAAVCGGGIQASGYGTYISGDAVISGNTAGTSGGGVFAANAHFSISGSSRITGNAAAASGGGIYAGGSSFFLSGAPVVGSNSLAGNTDNNLYLPANKYITVNGALSADASIGVTVADASSAFAKCDGTVLTSLEGYLACFISDVPTYTAYITDEKHMALRNA